MKDLITLYLSLHLTALFLRTLLEISEVSHLPQASPLRHVYH